MEKDRIANRCHLLVVGGSAGSLDVIIQLLSGLRDDLPFPVVIVLHRRNDPDSMLSELFSAKTYHPVKEADEKEALLPGHIYIAPADYHLLIEKNKTLSLDFSEKVNYSRPSIDVTFETAAEAYGTGTVCLLLSGASSDGTDGLKAVKANGGTVIVQDPADAEVAYMPKQAIAGVTVDYIVNADQMAQLINSFSTS